MLRKERLSSTVTIIHGYGDGPVVNQLSEILDRVWCGADVVSSHIRTRLAERRVAEPHDTQDIELTNELGMVFRGLLNAARKTCSRHVSLDVPYFRRETAVYTLAVRALAEHLDSIGYKPVIERLDGPEAAAQPENIYRLSVDFSETTGELMPGVLK